MITTERETKLLNLLARIPPACRVYYRPLPPLLRELGASREELADLVGRTAGEYTISFDRADSLRWEKVARTSTPVDVPSTASTPASSSAPAFQPAPAGGFDAVAVGKQAQDYQLAEEKAGRTISATDAVRHVLKSQANARVQPGTDGDPFWVGSPANEAMIAAQIAEVAARCRSGKRRS